MEEPGKGFSAQGEAGTADTPPSLFHQTRKRRWVMSYRVDGTTIYLTRGDTFEARVEAILPDSEGAEPYVPVEGDTVRFAMKANYEDEEPLVVKNIPIDTMLLILTPEDTKGLPFGKYVYDIQITYADGRVDTFITKARLRLTEEVD